MVMEGNFAVNQTDCVRYAQIRSLGVWMAWDMLVPWWVSG